MSDYAWIKGKWRPVKSYRMIKRGKKKGWLEVELFYPEGRLRIVPTNHVKTTEHTTAEQKQQKTRKSRK